MKWDYQPAITVLAQAVIMDTLAILLRDSHHPDLSKTKELLHHNLADKCTPR
jgi:hypothetical protein